MLPIILSVTSLKYIINLWLSSRSQDSQWIKISFTLLMEDSVTFTECKGLGLYAVVNTFVYTLQVCILYGMVIIQLANEHYRKTLPFLVLVLFMQHWELLLHKKPSITSPDPGIAPETLPDSHIWTTQPTRQNNEY